MRTGRWVIGLAALAASAALAQGAGMGMGMAMGGMPGRDGPMMGGGMMMRGEGCHHGGGPGMMAGASEGAGMMGFGHGMQNALGLTDEQRRKLDAIHDELQAKNWEIMGRMRVEMAKMRELLAAEPRDKAALDAAFKRVGDLRQQRFDARLAAHDQMEALLTREQRQHMRRHGPWWMHDVV